MNQYSQRLPAPNQELRTTASPSFNGITIRSLYDNDGTKSTPLTGEVRGIYLVTTAGTTYSIDDALYGTFNFFGTKAFYGDVSLRGTTHISDLHGVAGPGGDTISVGSAISSTAAISTTSTLHSDGAATFGSTVAITSGLTVYGSLSTFTHDVVVSGSASIGLTLTVGTIEGSTVNPIAVNHSMTVTGVLTATSMVTNTITAASGGVISTASTLDTAATLKTNTIAAHTGSTISLTGTLNATVALSAPTVSAQTLNKGTSGAISLTSPIDGSTSGVSISAATLIATTLRSSAGSGPATNVVLGSNLLYGVNGLTIDLGETSPVGGILKANKVYVKYLTTYNANVDIEVDRPITSTTGITANTLNSATYIRTDRLQSHTGGATIAVEDPMSTETLSTTGLYNASAMTSAVPVPYGLYTPRMDEVRMIIPGAAVPASVEGYTKISIDPGTGHAIMGWVVIGPGYITSASCDYRLSVARHSEIYLEKAWYSAAGSVLIKFGGTYLDNVFRRFRLTYAKIDGLGIPTMFIPFPNTVDVASNAEFRTTHPFEYGSATNCIGTVGVMDTGATVTVTMTLENDSTYLSLHSGNYLHCSTTGAARLW